MDATLYEPINFITSTKKLEWIFRMSLRNQDIQYL